MAIIQKKIKQLINRLAQKYSISYDDAEKAILAQYDLIKETIEEAIPGDDESFKNIRLIHFGIFAAKKTRLKYLNKTKKHGGKNKSDS